MKNSSSLLFLMITIFSALVVISSNNWISMWMGLEMNLMAFVPLISGTKNHFLSQSCMMYFLMQSMGSLLLLFTVLLNSMMLSKATIDSGYMNLIIMMSMWIKLGVPPFHFWFPEMMSKLNWMKCFLLMTLQKLAPLTILSTINNSYMLTLMITMSVLIGAMGGLNQTSIRKLMAYSSINHMGWMMSCILINANSWIIYLIMYTLMLTPIIMWLNKNKFYNMNQVNVFLTTNMEKLMVSMMMLSLGGMPPFIGFFPKWMVIQYMLEMDMKWTIIVMVLCSLLTLFFYMRMISSFYLMNSTMNKWMIKPSKSSTESTLMFTLNMALPLTMYMNMF
uniref:NADH-ubiquinone oxidoreductase chain 2 n=1 Tax=Nabicula flavomarginata TaxID=1656685 RepID=A0A343ISB3_9HEMI|nr:NADH dehydrogenase subunit 2 [Nabicula flavomarginata]AST10125.1 NADH dehydrogenase subunit 2 [Nabicula flavomarginata]